MGTYKAPTEGGSGGKRGHSNMEHWITTEEIKQSSTRRRRKEDKIKIAAGLKERTNKK